MNKKTNLLKAVVYRVYSSINTFIVSFLLTGNVIMSFSIGIIDSIIKIFSYYFFDRAWFSFMGYNLKPSVIWLTGFSGSGKTTIANELAVQLKKKSIVPVLLDGDEIRKAIKLHGFDEDSRKKHNLNVGYIASLFEKQGNIVIVAIISPYDDIRDEIRQMCTNFIEVHVSTNLETCKQRDPKGLYKKALSGEIKDFTGVSAPYFPPKNPELRIDTSNETVKQSTLKIYNYLKK